MYLERMLVVVFFKSVKMLHLPSNTSHSLRKHVKMLKCTQNAKQLHNSFGFLRKLHLPIKMPSKTGQMVVLEHFARINFLLRFLHTNTMMHFFYCRREDAFPMPTHSTNEFNGAISSPKRKEFVTDTIIDKLQFFLSSSFLCRLTWVTLEYSLHILLLHLIGGCLIRDIWFYSHATCCVEHVRAI